MTAFESRGPVKAPPVITHTLGVVYHKRKRAGLLQGLLQGQFLRRHA